MPGGQDADVLDLCSSSSGSDDDDDLPSFASLAERIRQRREAAAPNAAVPPAAPPPPPPPAGGSLASLGGPRPPLSVLRNHSAGSPANKLGGAEQPPALEPRPQYHQQEQRQERQQQQQLATAPPSSGPRRGKRAPAVPLPPRRESLDGSGIDQQAERLSPGAGVGDSPGGPAAKKQRRPRRTKEEIERDKVVKAQERAERQAVKDNTVKSKAVSQVRLLVDTALLSSAGSSARGSLGTHMLASLDEHNTRYPGADKRINYEVTPLDLAPYKTLRWQHRTLVPSGSQPAAGGGAGGSQQPGPGLGTQGSGTAGLVERWVDEPHVMVVFQAQEFVDAVCADRLAALLALLERRAPGQRPHILVNGLATHIEKQDRAGAREDVRAWRAPQQQSVRGLMRSFVDSLAVECPHLAFRQVVDPAEAAQHVRLTTVAIAQCHHRDSDATVFLRAHETSDKNSISNLFAKHPLDDELTKQVVYSLAAVPSVQPGIAHDLATNYGSLGGLMDLLLDTTRNDREKEQELANLLNVGTTKRAGPAAARQLLSLLRSDNPDLPIHADKQGGAVAASGRGGK